MCRKERRREGRELKGQNQEEAKSENRRAKDSHTHDEHAVVTEVGSGGATSLHDGGVFVEEM